MLSRHLKGGETIELVGDVGAGKTTFTQGLATGLGYSDDVPSPTFTISRTYPISEDRVLHHFDLYRLSGHDIVTDGLIEAMGDERAITIIEWPENGDAQKALPQERLQIIFEPGERESDRTITVRTVGTKLTQYIERLRNGYRPTH